MTTQHRQGINGGHQIAAKVRGNERALIVTSVLTGAYFVVELVLGILSGSVAVLSDAFHTFSAVGGVLIALVADRISRQPADRYRTFGSVRAEIIGALLNGVFLLAMAAFAIYMGVMRLLMPVEIETTLMLWAAAGGLATEAISTERNQRHAIGTQTAHLIGPRGRKMALSASLRAASCPLTHP